MIGLLLIALLGLAAPEEPAQVAQAGIITTHAVMTFVDRPVEERCRTQDLPNGKTMLICGDLA